MGAMANARRGTAWYQPEIQSWRACAGVDDLAVASPTSGWNWTEIEVVPAWIYRGHVSVFFGRKGASLPETPDYVISSSTVRARSSWRHRPTLVRDAHIHTCW